MPRRVLLVVIAVMMTVPLSWAQSTFSCSCGKNPPGRPQNREMRPYAEAPEDLRPYSKFTTPYYENYTSLDRVQRRGARHVPIQIPRPSPKCASVFLALSTIIPITRSVRRC